MDLFKRIIEQEKRAKEFGFYWENIEQLLEQMASEILEIKEAIQIGDKNHMKEEIGDLISASVSLCIFLELDPADVLKENTDKFQLRYDKLVKLVKDEGLPDLKNKSMKVLMDYWNRAKVK